jgi:recombination protein RecA
MLVRSNAVDLLVVDSVAALVPKAELEGDMGDSHVGLQARLMSQALRKLTANASNRSNTAIIFINQIRMKIGVMFGSPETTTGGNALKFYASVRLDVRRIGAIKVGKGRRPATAPASRSSRTSSPPPSREVEFDIMYGEGISREGDILDLAVEALTSSKNPARGSPTGERIGQGRENAKQFLTQNPRTPAVRAHHNLPPETTPQLLLSPDGEVIDSPAPLN